MATVDPEQLGFVGRVIAGVAGFATVAWGFFAFKKGREDKAIAKDEKAEEDRLAAVHERITKHDEANAAHLALIRKELENRRIAEVTLFQELRSHDKDDRDRHDQLMQTISGMHVSLLEKIGER